jgi:hypothetical protein
MPARNPTARSAAHVRRRFPPSLPTRDWILADGATGTTLFNMGLQSGDAPELWNVDHPDRIATLYRGAVEAGLRPVPDELLRGHGRAAEAA